MLGARWEAAKVPAVDAKVLVDDDETEEGRGADAAARRRARRASIVVLWKRVRVRLGYWVGEWEKGKRSVRRGNWWSW